MADISVALELDTSKFERGMTRAKGQVKDFTGEAKLATSALAGLFSVAAAGFVIKGAINTTRQLEELRGAFTTVTGSVENSISEFQRVRDLSNALGADTDALAEAYVKLAGAGIEPTTDLLTAFVDMSKNATDQLGALTAVSDLFSRTTAGGLGLEELNRLQDRGINAFGILQDELGLSRTQISEFGKTAAGAAQIQEALFRGFEKRFGGTAIRELSSINSQLSIFNNITAEVQESFGQQFSGAIVQGVGGLSNFRDAANSAATALGQSLGQALVFLMNNLNTIIPIVVGFGTAWAAVQVFELARGIMEMTKAMLALTASMLRNPFTILAVAAAALIAYIVDLSIKLGGVGNAFKSMANAGIDAINMLYNAWGGFSTFISTLMPHIAEAIMNGLNPFNDAGFTDTIAQGYRDAMEKAQKAASSGKRLIDFKFTLSPVEPANVPAPVATSGGGFVPASGGASATVDKAAQRAAASAADARSDLIRDLERQVSLLRDRTALEQSVIGLGEIRTEQLNKQQQLKEREAADIIKIRELEGLSAADRTAAIERVTELYSTLRAESDSTTASLINARRAFEQRGALGEVAIDAELARRQLSQLTILNKTFNETQREILAERFDIENDFYKRIELVKLNFADLSDAELQAEIERITQLRDAVLEAFDSLAPARGELSEAQKSFSEGWSTAMNKFLEDINDNAAYAERIFTTLTDGFSDAILNFVETGKLSFKDLFRSLMAEIIKMQANKLFASLFLGPSSLFGNMFAGFFNTGGRIPSGKFGIAGERGPEIISGPANVVSTAKTAELLNQRAPEPTVVNYNINAVDALSFKQLVAQDPAFIYNLTRVGSRRIPR